MIQSAAAETQFYTSIGSAAEAAWTTCPAFAQFDGQICNYTATYAARATNFQPFIVIQMAVLRLFRNGAVELADIATGYMQPASVANFQFQLGSASAAGTAALYGRCGNPNDISTCVLLGVGTISVNWSASTGPTSWNEVKDLTTPERIVYVAKTSAASSSANVSGSAIFNGVTWALGTPVAARTLQFTINESLDCPQTCPITASQNTDTLSHPVMPLAEDPDSAQLRQQNAPDITTADASAQAISNLFDFSPLGQVNSIFRATGFYGPATRGLGDFTQNLLASYIQSGRSFGFYPQAFNNPAFFKSANFNSSGVFFKFK